MTAFNYHPDSTHIFSVLHSLPGAVFLDSGFPMQSSGRFDILAACPRITISTCNEITTIVENGNKTESFDNPFKILQTILTQRSVESDASDLPFNGGAIGYFSYDLGRRLEKLPSIALADLPFPDMCVGIYDWAIVVDHLKQKTFLVGDKNIQKDPNFKEIFNHIINSVAEDFMGDFKILSPFKSNFSREKYAEAFYRIKNHLIQGDCYQVNLAQRFEAEMRGSSWNLYRHLRQKNPANFGAYLRNAEGEILSFSPERFLQVVDNTVVTKPIKGTIARGKTFEEDCQAIDNLLASQKDRSENTMIVDLMRNDLSKSCVAGSVQVPELCALETLPSVHHLVSTITGKLAPHKHSLDILQDCFPGGSVTGAPKIRAMEIIEALEPHRRSVYCGAIGYIGYNGNIDTNIAIRPLLASKNHLYTYAGGAITADSTLESEYQETLDKIEAILNLVTDGQILPGV